MDARTVVALASLSIFAFGCKDDGKGGDGDGTASDSATGDTNPTSQDGSASASDTADTSASTTSTGTGSSEGGDPKFDIAFETEGETEQGECDCGSQLGFSYIWIANSSESTVSKINTQTLMEEGRYLTRDDNNGNPSRTSVSLSGRKAAVNNRNGGVIAFWADPQLCDEMANGQPGLQTSMGQNDTLPWGQDDCRIWYTPFTHTTQRPIAWAGGILDADCDVMGEKLWTAGCNTAQHTYMQAHRLDGDNGDILDNVSIDGMACESLGGYGGAVDGQGNFWLTNYHYSGTPTLAFVDAVTLEVKTWIPPIGAYGMTVDHLGRPWLQTGFQGPATALRFDPQLEIFEPADNNRACGASGIQEDQEGRMWVNFWGWNGGCGGGYGDNVPGGLAYIDVETLVVSEPVMQNYAAKGLSVDLDGNVWSIPQGSTRAYRYNPDSQQLDFYDGLNAPYTYSDMTGWALQNAACDPEG